MYTYVSYIYVCVCACVFCVCVRASVCAWEHVCVRACVCACVHCTSICIDMCIYIVLTCWNVRWNISYACYDACTGIRTSSSQHIYIYVMYILHIYRYWHVHIDVIESFFSVNRCISHVWYDACTGARTSSSRNKQMIVMYILYIYILHIHIRTFSLTHLEMYNNVFLLYEITHAQVHLQGEAAVYICIYIYLTYNYVFIDLFWSVTRLIRTVFYAWHDDACTSARRSSSVNI